MNKFSYITVAVCCCVLLPHSVSARDWGRVSTSHLDDDPVEAFYMPVLFGVSIERVTPDFGDPRGGGTRSHEGQDFIVPRGTPVVSPTDAVVTYIGDGESSGLMVSTINPGGESFRYMHLDTIANIKRGTKLRAGDLVGTVGDTGNAPDGLYHLHFEVLDKDRAPIDPYPRITKSLSIKEKAALLSGIIADTKSKKSAYAKLLVETFPQDFLKMQSLGLKLPREISTALKGKSPSAAQRADMSKLIPAIPALLPAQIASGDSGAAVQLLQLYLMLTGDGPAIDALMKSGPTGYYGPVTEAAVRAQQKATNVAETGIFDAKTRAAWSK
jgi:peptidoglycan LD-endopeptidase LytH